MITFRADKGEALTYAEMDTNLGSYFYSSSLQDNGTTLVLYYATSSNVPINQTAHSIPLGSGFTANGSAGNIPVFSGTTNLINATGFKYYENRVGINVGDLSTWNTGTPGLTITGSLYTEGDLDIKGDIIITGSIYASGSISAEGFLQSSDIRLKRDIRDISNPLERIVSSKGHVYKMSTEEDEIGVIAQEVQHTIPEAVRETDSGFLTVNYSGIIGVLIEAVKEQQILISNLEQRIFTLENTK